MTKVANAESVLRRASRLVKPGGLLLVEEADVLSFGNSGGPATRRFIGKVKEIQDSLGADVEFGRKVEGIVGALGTFEEVHVEKISLPFGGNGPGEFGFQRRLPMLIVQFEFELNQTRR